MQHARTSLLATATVIGSGLLWGFYWVPVRELNALGLSGAWGTLAITLAAALVLWPVVVFRNRKLWRSDPGALAAIALGGVAFCLYSIGFVYGHVAIIILLFFLTPVWSTLIGRFVMGWDTPALRLVAIVVGLLGLATMLSAGGGVPLPRGLGEWMALAAGLLWAISTTVIRVRPGPAPLEAAFVFAVGAAVASAAMAPGLGASPGVIHWGSVAIWACVAGLLWWGPAIAALMWATTQLDPVRVGILLMSEVLVGAASAALIAGETLSPIEVIGGSLVLCAGVLEVWPVKRHR
ncbi:DMT family transporter [Rhodobacteraceae bacterium N5(2021)]|uniref:DMT family transporter n=1 Tax=Gymnodinialimonas phycosphaerae TaxID=2841589 RepID=A0A975TZQ5_9RHOB|nr:DMT family transporter [Gymnodinialimonas phycosphaerae]MBY4892986.1 DMT family transporter [Gymnodinialimonas phycosphaerae]